MEVMKIILMGTLLIVTIQLVRALRARNRERVIYSYMRLRTELIAMLEMDGESLGEKERRQFLTLLENVSLTVDRFEEVKDDFRARELIGMLRGPDTCNASDSSGPQTDGMDLRIKELYIRQMLCYIEGVFLLNPLFRLAFTFGILVTLGHLLLLLGLMKGRQLLQFHELTANVRSPHCYG